MARYMPVYRSMCKKFIYSQPLLFYITLYLYLDDDDEEQAERALWHRAAPFYHYALQRKR